MWLDVDLFIIFIVIQFTIRKGLFRGGGQIYYTLFSNYCVYRQQIKQYNTANFISTGIGIALPWIETNKTIHVNTIKVNLYMLL